MSSDHDCRVAQYRRHGEGRWGAASSDLKVPASLFHGDIDDRVPVHHAEHLARVIPGSHLTVYPGKGHMIVFERAPEFLNALKD